MYKSKHLKEPSPYNRPHPNSDFIILVCSKFYNDIDIMFNNKTIIIQHLTTFSNIAFSFSIQNLNIYDKITLICMALIGRVYFLTC